jgi:hypothetical protein
MTPCLSALVAFASLLLLSCSNGPASGFIDIETLEGSQSLDISIVYPGTPCDVGGTEPQGQPVTIGACTYSPPVAVADPPPGCGSPYTGANAGTISFVDTTSSSPLGTFSYESGDYTPLAGASPSVPWHAGDTITVTATGDSVGAFSRSVRALSTPSLTFPSPPVGSSDLTVAWVPDENAQSMTISMFNDEDDSSLICRVSDSLGTVTIASRLLHSESPTMVSAERETDETIVDGSTSLQLRSFAIATAPIPAR